jgi:hypothetical protein
MDVTDTTAETAGPAVAGTVGPHLVAASEGLARTIVISFDLDGTLQFGDPPGPIPCTTVRALRQAGAAVGSASDRTARDQIRLWQRFGLEADFAVAKAQLRLIPSRYPTRRLVHIGDRFADYLEASNAGALFVHVDALTSSEWLDPDQLYRAIRSELWPQGGPTERRLPTAEAATFDSA